jgi:hypothetical protein
MDGTLNIAGLAITLDVLKIVSGIDEFNQLSGALQ